MAELKCNHLRSTSIYDKVTLNLNVFGPFMEYMILGKVDDILIITMHRYRSRLSEIKLHQ